MIILSSLPFGSFGQSKSDYETEEIKVINQFLFKILDGERLSVFKNNSHYSQEENSVDKVIGTANISRISFNKSLKNGYFYYRIYCGEECGWGALVKIEKKNGVWEIIDYLTSWIS